eukprot:TRINITY_DN23164_c0_g1_i1.p1 TRINITY_DN23164_c0_g1~~TRINITY_DN23164_c0_g1_i1.p1  ORF type:complete len:722 (+),score=109.23 TRINITY_DN23164_c0_g1_i1:202-2166(+)
MALLTLATLVFHALFDSWEYRLSRLERQNEDLRELVVSLDQRLAALVPAAHRGDSSDEGSRAGLTARLASPDAGAVAVRGGGAISPPPQCTPSFSEFTTRQQMEEVGWLIDVKDLELDVGVRGWSGGYEVGTFRAFLHVAGTLRMTVGNIHDAKDDENWVSVALNGEQVATLGPMQTVKLCLSVTPGDVLTVREKYGKIWVRSVQLRCTAPATLTPEAGQASDAKLTWLGAAETQCTKGQIVRWRSRMRGSDRWFHGRILQTLNTSRALVEVTARVGASFDGKVAKGSPDGASHRTPALLNAAELHGEVRSEFRRCRTLAFSPTADRGVGIVVVANRQFLNNYKVHVQSQQCFAGWRGYDHWVLRPGSYEACDDLVDNIFFEKHCIVAEFLKEQAPGYVAVVVDADVMAVVLERGFEQWLNSEADLIFYERDFHAEIAAGNYVARNTPAARNFLMQWARFKFRQPPGFSSADNGAIHLHLVETIVGIKAFRQPASLPKRPREQSRGVKKCASMYANLTALVENLEPYFAYVRCTLQLLGGHGTWSLRGGGHVALWPRLNFLVADGFMFERKSNVVEGPVFHHGIKREDEAIRQYLSLRHCALNEQSFAVRAGELGRMAMSFARTHKDLFKMGNCPRCVSDCLPTLSCIPYKAGV